MFGLKFVKVQKGFTLFEALVAVAIFGVVGVGFITALDANSRGNRVVDEQVVAVNLATEHIEVIRQQSFADNYTSAVDNITRPFQYDVDIEYKFTDDGQTWYDTSSANRTLQRIIIAISREGRPVFSMCTYKVEQ
jgi:prepilin-type N-terminal cleavage/methylation domain-containing protein